MSATNQRIDGRRLWDSLMAMAEIGATEKGGVRRLALGPVDKAGTRTVPALVRGCGAHGPGGQHGQYVRPPPRP